MENEGRGAAETVVKTGIRIAPERARDERPKVVSRAI